MNDATAQALETPEDRTVIRAPWLQPVWQRFLAMQAQGRLPHALMVAGDAGLGTWPLARMMALAVLCERPGVDGACGDCPACRQAMAGVHPDLHSLAIQDERSLISVDTIRDLIGAFALTRRGRYRVALIERAERMNVQAANALLKTLEEPPSGSLMILTSQRADHLPATIRSRVQRLAVAEPDRETVIAWLTGTYDMDRAEAEIAWFGGAESLYLGQVPELDWKTATRALAELLSGQASPLGVALRWQGMDASQLATWLLRLWSEVARVQNGLACQAPEILQTVVQRLASVIDRDRWLRCHPILLAFARQANHPLNRALALERLAIDLANPGLPARLT